MKRQSQPFVFSKRHYTLILDQAKKNLPQESGGFLGGTDRVVKAVLPTFNKHLENRTDTFGLTSEDIERAHAFFAQHGLEYFGVYHSHPKGQAYPSQPDIQTGQRYHFIIGCADPENPILAAYEIIRNQPEFVPIQLMSDSQITPISIHPGKNGETPPKTTSVRQGVPTANESPILGDLSHLINRIDNLRKEKPNVYPKLAPPNRGSDFSTLA